MKNIYKYLLFLLFICCTGLGTEKVFGQCDNRFSFEAINGGTSGKIIVRLPGKPTYNVFLYRETATGDVLVKEYRNINHKQVEFINLSIEPLYLVKVEFLSLKDKPKCFSRTTLVRFLTSNE